MLPKKLGIAILVSCISAHGSDAVRAQGYQLRIEAPASVPSGSEFEARLVGLSLARLIGYSASVRYDSALTLLSISVEDTPWESADLVFVDEQPATGTVSIGVILDSDGQGARNVDALGATTFARLAFATTEPAVATIGFTDNPDFNLLIDVDLNGYSDTNLRLLEAQVLVQSGDGGREFLRGDCNSDSKADIADAIFHLRRLFLGGTRPICDDACDANDTGELDISDPVWLLSHLFVGGPAPPAPFPQPGVDPTADSLTCGAVP